jgi:hypothetical protein
MMYSFNLTSDNSDGELLEPHIEKLITQDLAKLCEESPADEVEKKKVRTWKLMELLIEEPNAVRNCMTGRRLA